MRHLVIGGLAVTAVGEPRLTADIDVIIYGPPDEVEPLLDYATKHGFTADIAAELEAARDGGSIRIDRGASTST